MTTTQRHNFVLQQLVLCRDCLNHTTRELDIKIAANSQTKLDESVYISTSNALGAIDLTIKLVKETLPQT